MFGSSSGSVIEKQSRGNSSIAPRTNQKVNLSPFTMGFGTFLCSPFCIGRALRAATIRNPNSAFRNFKIQPRGALVMVNPLASFHEFHPHIFGSLDIRNPDPGPDRVRLHGEFRSLAL